MPAALYLQTIYNVLGSFKNGRTVHSRENLRQSLGFFIWMKEHKIEMSTTQDLELDELIFRSKKFIEKESQVLTGKSNYQS
jgi:hypothetical protein